MAYTRMAHKMQRNYSAIKAALSERFEPPSKRQLYKVEFESCRKSWASKAFPSLQDKAREELALSKYLDQLSNPQVSFGVKQCCPKTINEAISSTIELESYLVKSTSCADKSRAADHSCHPIQTGECYRDVGKVGWTSRETRAEFSK